MAVELTDADTATLASIIEWFNTSAEPEHKQYEDAWNNQDRLYFNHKEMVKAHSAARTVVGKDTVIRDARKQFGEELHIPYVFATMETVMPRTISNRPEMLWLPRDKTAASNVENVRIICDAQQQRCDYELKLMTVIRSGLKHGLGIMKGPYWRLDQRDTFAIVKNEQTGDYVRTPVQKTAWDDPDCEAVDIRDFYWDRFATGIGNLRKCVHRTWRDTAYCLKKIDSGEWPRYPLTTEDLEGGSGKDAYDQAWGERRRAAGLTSAGAERDVHEVWEVYDTNDNSVTTIVDRMWIVQVIQFPYWHGELIFSAYRPIEVEHRFVGYGVIDPIEDLQRELNWLRTDRRWNAMMKLHQAYAYQDGTLDPSRVKIGPGALIPVNGDPHDLLVPLTVGDIPNSGYQEEAALRTDIELATGVSDQTSGVGSAGETATGVQLVQAAAGLRIQAYTHRAELEVCRPNARQWLAVNQQRWVAPRPVPFPAQPQPGDPERFWNIRMVGPEGIAGEFDVVPDGGAMAPENVPQKRNDAMLMMQLANTPAGMQILDQQKVMEFILDNLGVPAVGSYLKQPDSVPAQTLTILQQILTQRLNVPPELANGAIVMALQTQQQLQQEAANQQARSPGGAPSGQQAPPPTQNGAVPPAPAAG